MPLVSAFTATQILGEPSIIKLTDASTGSDAAITARRVYLRLANGSYLVPDGTTTDYVNWPLADATLELDVLTVDKAVDITVQHLNSSGVAIYTKTTLCLFTQYAKQFLYNLTQGQSGNTGLVNDNQYWEKKSQLFTEVDSALNAVEMANDLFGAQGCLDRAQKIIDNAESYFFQ
jgi:hypothetical protein